MNIPDLHRRAVEEFDRHVRAVEDDQWHLDTPCSDWDVRALVNHLVNEDRWTPPLMDGETIEDVGDRFDGDLLGDAPKGIWEEASKEAMVAVQAPGAMERIVHLSFGDHPGSEYAWQLFVDHLIHAWDLARGIRGDDKLDPELVEICYERSKPEEDALKSFGVFGDKIEPPPGADRQTQLLAIFGRRA
ncbi:MAG: TIGR03086 family metal-binding protein [Actinomycetota bacterium]